MARARSKNSVKAASSEALALEQVEPLIHAIRGEKVILDSDLARLYGATAKRLNEQVKRNRDRFPADFMFQLTAKESAASRSQFATSSAQGVDPKGDKTNWSQIATSSRKHRGIVYRPYAFTEHGAIMAANVSIARGKGTHAATRHSRSRHRHCASTRDGHHRSAESAARPGQTEDWVQAMIACEENQNAPATRRDAFLLAHS